MIIDPLSVACPRCNAQPRWGCHTVSHTGHWACCTHRARWKAIGVPKPTPEQVAAAYAIEKQHRADLNNEYHARMKELRATP